MQRRTLVGLTALTLAFVSFLPASADAQSFGVRGGINLANLSESGSAVAEATDTRIGPVAGLYMTTATDWPFVLHAEALFSVKGAKDKALSEEVKLTYLEVPVLARWNSRQSGDARFYVMAGPSFGFKLDAKAIENDVDFDIDEDIENFDLGLLAGGGVELGRLSADARYTWGLRNIAKFATGDNSIKNRVFTVTIGYRFR